jgi:Trypsin
MYKTMLHKFLKLTTFSLLIFLTCFAGVTRHDVNIKKHIDLAKQKQFDCVGHVLRDTTDNGSCVLISEKYVLSAAHCFIESDTRLDTFEVNGNTITVYVPINRRLVDAKRITVNFNGQIVKCKKLLIHPNYLDSATKGSCDIAILELEEPIKNISVPKLNAQFDELNSKVVGVGFGASGPATRPDLVAQKGLKIAGENVIDTLLGEKYLDRETLLTCDFDHPKNRGANQYGSAKPLALEYICASGDSGGGLFRKNGNDWELIGICATTAIEATRFQKFGYYSQTMGFTRISALLPWIQNGTMAK